MSDQTIRRVVRGFVLVVAALAITGAIAANVVLSRGSGTYFATMVFVPFFLAPGVLVWRRPNPGFLAVWAVAGGFTSFVYLIGGNPYHHERALSGWTYVVTPLWLAMGIGVFGSTLGGFALAAYDRRDTEVAPEDLELAQRMRRVVKLAMCAGATGTACFFIENPATHPVIGVATGLFVLLALTPGWLVYQAPRPMHALYWALWATPFALIAAFVLMLADMNWPLSLRIGTGALGTMFVFIVLLLPLVAIVTRRRAPAGVPEARVR